MEVKIKKNIDILNIGRGCGQNCTQCFAVEQSDSQQPIQEEIKKAKRIIKNNRNTKFFIYPKEIATNPELINLISEVGQQYVLSNGRLILEKETVLAELKANGIRKINITLFANEEEQFFWNQNTPNEYRKILKGIEFCSQQGLKTAIYTIVTPCNIALLPKLFNLSKSLGVSKINLIRILPVGRAKDIEKKYLIKEKDLEELLLVTDYLKQSAGPRISFSLGFGPDFYGKSVWRFLKGDTSSWVATDTLCPAIDNNYAGISMKTGNIYWCYFLLSKPDTVIGRVGKEGELIINSQPDFSKETLKDKLRGICSKDSCYYQDLCLGGCRSFAYIFAELRGEKEPLYAGMDLCRTDAKRKMQKDIPKPSESLRRLAIKPSFFGYARESYGFSKKIPITSEKPTLKTETTFTSNWRLV